MHCRARPQGRICTAKLLNCEKRGVTFTGARNKYSSRLQLFDKRPAMVPESTMPPSISER